MQAPAAAGVVGTAEAIAQPGPTARAPSSMRRSRARTCAPSSSELGVDPAAIEGRLAALSEAGVATLAGQIDEAPAGGDALAVIGIVFVVLIILELVGVIDIFKKT